MTDDIVVRTMTMDEFDTLPARGTRGSRASPQAQCVQALAPGEAIVLSHENLKHDSMAACSFRSMVAYKTKTAKGRRYMLRHLPDGTVAVACVAIQEES